MKQTARNSRKRWRASTALVVVAFFFVVSMDAPPSTSDARPAPPSPEDVIVLDELLDWVGGEPQSLAVDSAGGVEAAIADVVRHRRRSFELFRSYNGEAARARLLETLPYGSQIRRAARRHGVDGLLLAAVIETESSFDPNALSIDGAMGLMQIMPATADLFGASDVTQASVNIDVGTRYLRYLIDSYDGDIELALAAYNAGPGNVLRFDGVPPFGETQRYVDSVLTRYVAHHQTLWSQAGGAGSLLPGAS